MLQYTVPVIQPGMVVQYQLGLEFRVLNQFNINEPLDSFVPQAPPRNKGWFLAA